MDEPEGESTSDLKDDEIASLSNIPIIYVEDLSPGTSQNIQQFDESASLASTSETYSDTTSSSAKIEQGNTYKKPSIGNFDLINFLKNDIVGEALLCKAAKFKLDNTDRDRLCEMLMKELINEHGKLNAEDFFVLSKKIVNAFPLELCSTYYIAAVPKTVSIKHEHEKARGKLIDKQRNLLYLIKRLKQNNPTEEEKTFNIEGKASAADIT